MPSDEDILEPYRSGWRLPDARVNEEGYLKAAEKVQEAYKYPESSRDVDLGFDLEEARRFTSHKGTILLADRQVGVSRLAFQFRQRSASRYLCSAVISGPSSRGKTMVLHKKKNRGSPSM